ncbi:MAG: D-alanine--D-alanine ligase, partial [Pseudomonadales bacterium]|nr:D-alanine--D-alanine ligase [Pseudomonadales bacterium]
MRIAIVFNDPGETAPDQDVLVQRDAVTVALRAAGHEIIPVSCTLDLERLLQILQGLNVDCAFNLVESLGGTDRLACLMPQLLDAAGIPCTGSGAKAMLSTDEKVWVKQALRDNGLPAPDWVVGEDTVVTGGTFIIKPRFEHASNGIDDEAVVSVNSAQELLASLHRRRRKTGLPLFSERFIEGREFNIAAVVAG